MAMQALLPGIPRVCVPSRVERILALLREAESEVDAPLTEHDPDALHDIWQRVRNDISDALHAFDLAKTEMEIDKAFAETV